MLITTVVNYNLSIDYHGWMQLKSFRTVILYKFYECFMGQNINVFCVFFSFNLKCMYCRNLNQKDVSEGDLDL